MLDKNCKYHKVYVCKMTITFNAIMCTFSRSGRARDKHFSVKYRVTENEETERLNFINLPFINFLNHDYTQFISINFLQMTISFKLDTAV